jgi:hypothetical protein
VAIVDAYDDPNAASDLATYRSTYGLPACGSGCFQKLNQTGATSPLPSGNSDWGTEISLDIDMVSAICPTCHIDLIEANSNSFSDLSTAAEEAATLPGVVAISNSYAGGEFSSETSYDTDYSHPGIITTASSGDDGYGVGYPAASAGITAVGGTSLTKVSSPRGWYETAWSGAGSGCSAYEPKPAWQHDGQCTKRTVADVSAVADPSTPVAIYDTYDSGGWGLVGGTSVSSPIVASIAAYTTLNFRYDGTARPFYDMAKGYVGVSSAGFGINDVTSGSSGSCSNSYLCTAGNGYDGPTGLGSLLSTPRGSEAYVWANEPSTASYTPSSYYSYNSYGATNTITRQSTGVYVVHLPYMADGGTVNVTAYDGDDNCKVDYWSHSGFGYNALENVVVDCYTPAGAPSDSYYDVSFVNQAGRVGSSDFAADSLGYLWANAPTTASYTPSLYYQYSNFDDVNTITRNSTGVYTITFTFLQPVPTSDGGAVKITAYGSNDDTCQSGGWGGSGSPSYNESVTVRCFTPSGAAADSEFSATFSADLALTGIGSSLNGYLWSAAPSSTGLQTPPATWSFNSVGDTNSVQRTSVGNYTVTLPGLTKVGGNVEVTAYGSYDTSCVSDGWGTGSSGTTAYVECFNRLGAASDSDFNLQYGT